MGLETGADCAVYRLNSKTAIVQSLDFFTPIIDDPFLFGQIAAANSLSDIYAAGAKPILAMNIVCFPLKKRPKEELKAILQGGLSKIKEAGALLSGGHSVEDPEPKYGLSVTGIVDPDRFLSNRGAKPGDWLLLTKPVGTGILATAHKAGLLDQESLDIMIDTMRTLNRRASELMVQMNAHAVTDITGFGLGGHAIEMARASGCRIILDAAEIPVLPRCVEFLQMGFIPEGDYENRKYCSKLVKIREGMDASLIDIVFDAQTSGGLLISLPPKEAEAMMKQLKRDYPLPCAIIGRIEQGEPGLHIQ